MNSLGCYSRSDAKLKRSLLPIFQGKVVRIFLHTPIKMAVFWYGGPCSLVDGNRLSEKLLMEAVSTS
jgi:hypothetical protein